MQAERNPGENTHLHFYVADSRWPTAREKYERTDNTVGHERDVRRSVCHYDTPTLISLMSICVYGIILEHHYRDGLRHLITARLYRRPFTLIEDTMQV